MLTQAISAVLQVKFFGDHLQASVAVPWPLGGLPVTVQFKAVPVRVIEIKHFGISVV